MALLKLLPTPDLRQAQVGTLPLNDSKPHGTF